MIDAQQRAAAKAFAKNWKDRGYEKGDSQIFWVELLTTVFGVTEISQFISFEDQVHLDHTSFIDGYIEKTHVMIEQKSINKSLTAAIRQSDGSMLTPFEQAKRYSSELPYSKRPRWIVTSNFQSFYIYDMEKPGGDPEIIQLENLEKEYYRLQFLVDEGNTNLQREMEVSIAAGEIVGLLYDALAKQYVDSTTERAMKSLNILSIDQFYGIEINDFAVTVAKTALWIAELQMMKETENIVHMNLDFLPLITNAFIVEGNSLQIDWESVVPKYQVSYIMGNPPFVGARVMSSEQKDDVKEIFQGWKNVGNMDYVCCWYKKCADFMKNTSIRAALVSTNSVSQGESVANLWKPLLENDVHIDFAYRTFQWDSEAKIKHHNVIFVGRDADGIPRYAHCRGSGEITYRGDVAGSDKSYGFSYRGTDNQLFVFEAAIDLLSFIQLFPKDWKKRSYLSLGGISSVALMTFLSERPQITSVFLCLDNDQAGNEACEKLAGEISEGYSVIRLKPSRKDWNEILCDKNTDRKKAIAETITIKVPEAEELVPMLCYEDIKQTSVEWLWFPYIPFGKLTIIQGNPGEGKTYFAMMLTAACTNRKLFPNMEDIEPFNVIYQTAEDGMGDTIKPRLIEAGADLSRVMVIDDTEEALTLSDDRIEKAVRQNRVRLVIIDPVQAFIGADVDMNRANEVRPVFRKLGMIAEKTGCAIVLIGHLNKSSGTQSTYRGLGSIDIMAAVRSLIFIGKVRKDPTTRVLIHEKSSLAPPGETMAFKLGDEEGFRWVGAYEISADELLDGKEGKATETKLERGTKLIKELLADKKEISIRELDEKAKEQGISGRTMRDVRSRMKNELEYQVNEKQENSIRLKE